MKYRKRPVIIDAEQFWPHEMKWPDRVEEDKNGLGFIIHTLEGWYTVTPGDWIITGIKGEKYPCKPDIFEATYEPVDKP
jgi:hypothetical protein